MIDLAYEIRQHDSDRLNDRGFHFFGYWAAKNCHVAVAKVSDISIAIVAAMDQKGTPLNRERII